MNIAICDDEAEMLCKIHTSVKSAFEVLNVAAECHSFSTPEGLLKYIDDNSVNAVFLDIDMPHISGMEIANRISTKMPETAIVFVTCHDALVYDTFKYRPFSFIRKSHFDVEIGGVIERLTKHFAQMQSELTLCRGSQIIRIKTSDIIYIEANGNYLDIHTVNGIERQRDTLTNIEASLNGDFVRVHKGFIVNMNYIDRKDGEQLVLSNGLCVPVGRTYEKNVRQRLLQSFRRKD